LGAFRIIFSLFFKAEKNIAKIISGAMIRAQFVFKILGLKIRCKSPIFKPVKNGIVKRVNANNKYGKFKIFFDIYKLYTKKKPEKSRAFLSTDINQN